MLCIACNKLLKTVTNNKCKRIFHWLLYERRAAHGSVKFILSYFTSSFFVLV
nr:MAG TPA: hypothetical protein [Crassvirales sp.]